MPEENVEELKEKLSKMSPEELREFQKKNCIFCHIVANKVQSKKIYEDEKCCAILDINPANPGHILLLPKEHYAIMPQMPDDIVKHLGKISKHLSKAALKSLKAEGTTIFIANGVAAGQKAQHFMMHIIPRMPKDGLPLDLSPKDVPEGLNVKIKKVVQPNIYKSLGINFTPEKEPEVEVEKPSPVRKAEMSEDVMVSGKEDERDGKEDNESEDNGNEEREGRESEDKEEKKPARKNKPKKKDIDLDDIAGLFS